MRRDDKGDSWRYDVTRMPLPPRTTIVVLEESPEHRAERRRQIEEGAEVMPFGFARALPVTERPVVEPQVWEGDNS